MNPINGLLAFKKHAHDEVAGKRTGSIPETAWAGKGRVAKAQKDGPGGTGVIGERAVLKSSQIPPHKQQTRGHSLRGARLLLEICRS